MVVQAGERKSGTCVLNSIRTTFTGERSGEVRYSQERRGRHTGEHRVFNADHSNVSAKPFTKVSSQNCLDADRCISSVG